MTPLLAATAQHVSQDTYMEALFESATLEQMRLAIAEMYHEDETPSVRTRKDAVGALWATGRSRAYIADVLLGIEAKSPMKHCFLARLNTPEVVDTLINAPLGAKFQMGRITGILTRLDAKSPVKTLTIEHLVTVNEWQLIDDRTKQIEQTIIRHPIVVRLDSAERIATISYSGFSQGSATKIADRISYEALVDSLVEHLREKFGLSLSALPINQAILSLQDAESTRVRVLRTDFDAKNGRVLLTSENESKSVTQILLDMFAEHASAKTKKELESIISSGLRDVSSNSLVTLWVDEQVYTRARFWQYGTEFLFIWHGADTSLMVVDRIIKLISSVAKSISNNRTMHAWSAIGELKAGDIVTPQSIASYANGDPAEAKRVLLDAMRAALVVPVYRLRTSALLPDFQNKWTREASAVAKPHRTETGEIVDGSNPENIEVAFMRTGGEFSA